MNRNDAGRPRFKILIATRNPGKLNEFRELFRGLQADLRGLNEFTNVCDIAESGQTFESNAIQKAKTYSLQTRAWAVADDSGLEIDALGGKPGVFSARYGGEMTGYPEKNRMILSELDATGDEYRNARFVCAMALADPAGQVRMTSLGVCTGTIAQAPQGSGGFGYDPIFIPTNFTDAFGVMPDHLKRRISHRAHASTKIIRYLHDIISV